MNQIKKDEIKSSESGNNHPSSKGSFVLAFSFILLILIIIAAEMLFQKYQMK